MESIKQSKAILILLILYIGISIFVVTLDNKQKKKDSSKNNSAEKIEKEKESFLEEVQSVVASVDNYVLVNGINGEACIKLADISANYTSGSVYVDPINSSIRIWYSKDSYVLNNIEVKSKKPTTDDIEEKYTTYYYDSCGLNY